MALRSGAGAQLDGGEQPGDRRQIALPAAFVRLRDCDGVVGLGEAAPSRRYDETAETCLAFYERIDATRLSFDEIEGSMPYVK